LLHPPVIQHTPATALQGIETVRRDNCMLVRNMVGTVLDKLLIEKDEVGAQEYVRGLISDLLNNRVDMSLLVVTKVGGWVAPG
jgi:DNA polymerase delta subunit 1